MEKRLLLAKQLLNPDGRPDRHDRREGGPPPRPAAGAGLPGRTAADGHHRASTRSGATGEGDFARRGVRVLLLLGGAEVAPEPDPDYSVGTEVPWRTFRRSDLSSARGTPKGGKNQFFPIYVERGDGPDRGHRQAASTRRAPEQRPGSRRRDPGLPDALGRNRDELGPDPRRGRGAFGPWLPAGRAQDRGAAAVRDLLPDLRPDRRHRGGARPGGGARAVWGGDRPLRNVEAADAAHRLVEPLPQRRNRRDQCRQGAARRQAISLPEVRLRGAGLPAPLRRRPPRRADPRFLRRFRNGAARHLPPQRARTGDGDAASWSPTTRSKRKKRRS